LLYYVINASPEIPRLCKRLGKVVQQIVKYKLLDKIIFDIESILLDIQQLFDSQNDLVSILLFSPVDLSVYQINPLELLSETTSLNRSNQIQNLQIDSTESEEEGIQALAFNYFVSSLNNSVLN
jgi:hypothetical protein